MSENTETGQGDFWFNVNTKQVETGAQSDWTQLLGPYATRAEAEKALETVERRNQAWDAEDDA
ncbi:SPOR domain-containing protein [Arthrobacter sp. KK5.5]|uniref:SPOR domain-containing protein n=1 Tax=Arthrobacter sp. KK5.5 TaxID=3373084 RepID=UPI003EE74F6C